MRAPVRLREDPSAPAEVRELCPGRRTFEAASWGGARAVDHEIDRLMVVQAAAGIVLWVKGIAFAGLCMVGAVTAVQVVPGLSAACSTRTRSPKAPSRTPRRRG